MADQNNVSNELERLVIDWNCVATYLAGGRGNVLTDDMRSVPGFLQIMQQKAVNNLRKYIGIIGKSYLKFDRRNNRVFFNHGTTVHANGLADRLLKINVTGTALWTLHSK